MRAFKEVAKMKIIEAMKEIKELQRKSDDLCKKIAGNCALLDYESPLYGANQQKTVDGWIQSIHDMAKRIEFLRVCIQRTNLATNVEVILGEVPVTKTIAAWIHRRKDLAKAEYNTWKCLNDRGLKESTVPSTVPGVPATQIKIVRFFDPVRRDAMLNLFAGEPTNIDSRLEVINAITDLIET